MTEPWSDAPEYHDEMVSFGGGVNSVSMVVMLAQRGWRGPIVFADTGGEHPDTYCYLEYFEKHFLAQYGLSIDILKPGSPYHIKKSSIPLEDYCLKQGIVPFLAVRWCSVDWKRDPMKRWAKAHDKTVQLIGFSASEPGRVRSDPNLAYPLVDEGIHRPECRRIIERAGLLVPRKSGCFFCPGQSYTGWRNMHFEYPDLYERAIALEDNASERKKRKVTLDPHGVSLREHRERKWIGQQTLDLEAWLPCACSL